MLRDERGFTIIELAIAVLIVTVGLTAVAVGFIAPEKATQAAQRQGQAVQIAEADIESIIGRPYANIAVTSLPSHAEDSYPSDPGYTPNPNNPSNPLYYVNDPAFYKSGCEGTTFPALKNHYNAGEGQLIEAPACGEQLVPAKTEAEGGIPFEASTQSVIPNAPAGTVYNFITWRNEKCSVPQSEGWLKEQLEKHGVTKELTEQLVELTKNKKLPGLVFCENPNNEKRVTVAVVLNQPSSKPGLTKPVYVSTLVPDPQAGAPRPTEIICEEILKKPNERFGC